MNRAAQALGRRAKGVPKSFSPAELCRDSLPYRFCKMFRTQEVLDETLSAS